MDIEVNRLIAIIHKKNVDLTDLETKLVNRLRWGIVVLQSKNENLIRRQVLQWWRYTANYSMQLAVVVSQAAYRHFMSCACSVQGHLSGLPSWTGGSPSACHWLHLLLGFALQNKSFDKRCCMQMTDVLLRRAMHI